jgi:hypothetical protein
MMLVSPGMVGFSVILENQYIRISLIFHLGGQDYALLLRESVT